MTDQSPLQFAHQFEKLKSDLTRQKVFDLKILLLIDFWQNLAGVMEVSAYSSYIDEYSSILFELVSPENLRDFRIDEKQNLLDIVTKLTKGKNRKTKKTKRKIVIQSLIRDYFFVGDVENGLKICSDNYNINIPSAIAENLNNLDEYEAFNLIYDRSIKLSPPLHKTLLPIKIEWESIRESVGHEGVFCLFVEKDDYGKFYRGRMRILHGNIELFGESATTDEVTFDNQIKTPDDPFVGVAYDALKSVRNSFGIYSSRELINRYYHAHFSIKNSSQSFTGDSIGLAFGLTAYTGLLKNEIHRQKQFVASDVAFTGSLNSNGDIIAVIKETLYLKIERAFYSPAKYLVIPESNKKEAEKILKELSIQHKRRNLKLVSGSRLKDFIENRNIVREEKVCLGEYIGKKAARISHSTKIQVPFLICLLWILLAFLFPKYFNPWFDDNPQYVTLTKTGFVALNADSTALWYEDFKCDSIAATSKWKIGDINDDGKNEIAFVPRMNSACSCNVNLFVYSNEGIELFRRRCTILDEYPGDTTHFQSYSIQQLKIVKYEDKVILLTIVTQCMPARSHIKIWSITGDLLGWYINAGTVVAWEKLNKKGICDKLVFHGINNSMGSTCIFILSKDSSFGVSPPYFSTVFDLSWLKFGNQLKYLIFPPSDYSKALNRPYNNIFELYNEGIDEITVYIDEGEPEEFSNLLLYSLDSSMRVIDVKAADQFIDHRKDLVDEGRLPAVNLNEYLINLRDAVTYWTDSGWVTEGAIRATEEK